MKTIKYLLVFLFLMSSISHATIQNTVKFRLTKWDQCTDNSDCDGQYCCKKTDGNRCVADESECHSDEK